MIRFINKSGKVPVKLFSSVEEMNQSTGNKEGDLALIYASTISNWQVDTQSNVMIFPQTVTLQEAFTDFADLRFRPVDESASYVDFMGNISENNADIMIYVDELNANIRYTSEDGITYTKTEGDERVELPCEVKYEMPEMWNDVIGYFIQTGSATFNGLYNYKADNWTLAETQLNATNEYVYNKIYYGKNGVSEGTIATNPSMDFNDIDAEIYNKILNAYNNMEPKVVEDGFTVPDDILFIPTKADGTPLWDTSSVTDMSNMFSYCKNLETIPLLDTSSVTNMKNMFDGCDNLQTIPLLDTSSVSNMTNMFGGCKNLSNDSLNNILKMCINSKETDKRLKGIGLTQEQAEKCQTLSNWSDFVAAGWTTGY